MRPIDVYNFAKKGKDALFFTAFIQVHSNGFTNVYRDENGMTGCHFAAILGFWFIVDVFLRWGFDVNSMSRPGTLLFIAAFSGKMNIVQRLLMEDKISISSSVNNKTALHAAANRGHLDIVKLLLERGIEIDLVQMFGDGAYAPAENEHRADGTTIVFTNCNATIYAEYIDREKKAQFDAFIRHNIEYQPSINKIYSRCWDEARPQVAKPRLVSWTEAEAIRDKYYFDEIFFGCKCMLTITCQIGHLY